MLTEEETTLINWMRVKTLSETKDITPFAKMLLQQEPRFRFFGFADELFTDENMKRGVFVITNEHIFMPSIMATTEHEIAHWVEMQSQKRWLLNDWGIKLFPNYSDATNVSKKCYFASMTREIRVRAIQTHMEPNWDKNKIVDGHFWGAEAKKKLPFGRFKNEKTLQDWAVNLWDTTYNKWSLDRIVEEFNARLNYAREHILDCDTPKMKVA